MPAVNVFVAVAVVIIALVCVTDKSFVSVRDAKELLAQKNEYLVETLTAPRLAGLPLKFFAYVLNTPMLGSVIGKILLETNKFSLVSRLAAGLESHHFPIAYPNTTISREEHQFHQTHAENFHLETVFADILAAKQAKESKDPAKGFRFVSSADFIAQYKSGKTTPSVVAQTILDEIKRTNETLRAWAQIHPEEVLAMAQESTERYNAGKSLGPLDGVPVAVKDEMHMKGFYTSYGTAFLRHIEAEDCTVVRRLKDAGAIIIGKTTMHELGMGTSGVNMPFGTPRNPYDPRHYPGGSSAGSAVAAASGLVPIAIGCDGGGSIRIPSSLSGLFGLKPTFGRVPKTPNDCFSVCHIGPMTSNWEDAFLTYGILSGSSAEDHHSTQQPPIHALNIHNSDNLAGVRVGVFRKHANNAAPEIVAAWEKSIAVLEAKGAIVSDITIPFLHVFNKALTMVIAGEVGVGNFKFVEEHFNDYSPELHIVFGLVRQFTVTDLIAAQRVRHYATTVMRELFQQVDVIVSPTNSITALRVPDDVQSHGESDVESTSKMMAFAPLANFVGYPAMSIPVAHETTTNLPIGLHVEADMWREDLLLRIAHVLNDEITSKVRQPPKILQQVLHQ